MAAVPLTPAATPIDSIVDVEYALTCTAPVLRNTLSSTSAFTTLLRAASVAVRPKKFRARAAPPPAAPPPATAPANDWMVEVSRANTLSVAALTTMFTPSICASTVEVMPLVVLEPASPTEPPPAMPAAIDWMVPEVVACTFTAPVARSVLSARRALTPPPMSFTDTAAPAAALPEPLMVPASEKMLAALSALTVNAPPAVV